MSFERIAPYDVTRGDLVVGSIVISFHTGARSVRIRAALLVLLGLVAVAAGVTVGDYMLAGGSVLFLLFAFVLAPAIRSLKRSKDIDHDPDGVVAETRDIRTVYKWATIGSAVRIGSRLFIMVSDGHALVVPTMRPAPTTWRR